MKKVFSFLFVLCMLLSVMQVAQAQSGLGQAFEAIKPTEVGGLGQVFEGGKPTESGGLGVLFENTGATSAPEQTPTPTPIPTPTPMPYSEPVVFPEPAPALFDEGVRDFTCAAYGSRVDYAKIGGWTISRGYMMDVERYCLIGQAPNGELTALTDVLPMSFIPVGDAIVYYGKDEKSNYNWVIREPGAEKATRLDLSINDEIFYSDKDHIWYYTHIGEEISIRKLTHKGWAREGVARAQGFVVSMLESGGILVVNFDKNEILCVKDGINVLKTTTLYKPEEPIISVSTAGRSIWVEREHEFGLLENGELTFCLPGHIERMAGTSDQFVLLVSFPDSEIYDVMIFNDTYRAYAWVGHVLASENAFIELQTGQKITVWGPEESLIFDIPPAEEWIPYGFYDVASAREANDVPMPVFTMQLDPTPTQEPDDIVTITIPANLCNFTDDTAAVAQAEAGGIQMVVNRDGSYTYFMTPEQQQEQLTLRRQEIQDALEASVNTALYSEAIKAYTANDDFSMITFTVVADQLENSMAVAAIGIIGLYAPTYQALAGTSEVPVTVVKVIDQATGKIISTFTGPDDFMQ